MPERTCIYKEARSKPGFKAFKDRIKVLRGGPVAGYTLKPFVSWHCESPGPSSTSASTHHTLAVHCRSSRKAQMMTQLLFQDVLVNCYVSKTEKYCLKDNIRFKLLLMVENAPGHPPFIDDLPPNIKVMFFFPNTTFFDLTNGSRIYSSF